MSTKTGLQENVAGLLCYVLGWITGIIFLILEPENKFIKFHAIQSIIVFGILTVASWLFSWIFWLLGTLIGILTFILWVLLMYKAYQGERYKIPVAGDIADKNSQ